jgi:hypothetical protein
MRPGRVESFRSIGADGRIAILVIVGTGDRNGVDATKPPRQVDICTTFGAEWTIVGVRPSPADRALSFAFRSRLCHARPQADSLSADLIQLKWIGKPSPISIVEISVSGSPTTLV